MLWVQIQSLISVGCGGDGSNIKKMREADFYSPSYWLIS